MQNGLFCKIIFWPKNTPDLIYILLANLVYTHMVKQDLYFSKYDKYKQKFHQYINCEKKFTISYKK